MITFEFYGKQYEFRGEYRVPESNEFALSSNGTVLDFSEGCPVIDAIRAIVHPVRKRYNFGGVVFEEIGEVDWVPEDGWVMVAGKPAWSPTQMSGKYPLLRLVGLEDAE